MKIVLLNDQYEQPYDDFVSRQENGSLYSSLKYKKMLELLLGDKAYYFIALDNNNKIIGVLPSFIKRNENGNILNSLPFYGSNGAAVTSDNAARELLIQEFIKQVEANKCISSTIITSPFEKDNEWYANTLRPDFIDTRIGQITFFPQDGGNLQNELLSMFHKMVRRCLHKAQKSNVDVKVDNSQTAWNFLYKIHKKNMAKMGGLPKRKEFFDIVPAVFKQKEDYNIYVASINGVNVAALLVFYYNKTVEYFTPVTVEEYRTYQPLSLIIFQAMQDAIKRGYRQWNWGGTWLTQAGVYDFKRKWGTTEQNYYYFTNIKDKSIMEWSRSKIADNYQNYFIFPFTRGINSIGQEVSP